MLFEAVPNVSIGADREKVAQLTRRIEAVFQDAPRGALADVHADAEHDRTVLTLFGDSASLLAALVELVDFTAAEIDLRENSGVHPRIGALDVLPIIPLPLNQHGKLEARAFTPQEVRAAHALADEIAAYLGSQHAIPTIRYGLDQNGAPLRGAERTGVVRAGGIDRVFERIRGGELQQITGPGEPHGTAGYTMVGVRDILIAFNVDLKSRSIDDARTIANQIRASAQTPTALAHVRSLGLLIDDGLSVRAQVSTNLENYRKNGPARVLKTVAQLARQINVELEAAELVGLAPTSAVAALNYSCAQLGLPLKAANRPAIEEHTRRLS